MADNLVELIIRARDQASPEVQRILDQISSALRDQQKKNTEAQGTFAGAVRESTQLVDAMAGAVVGRLSPALGQAVQGISLAAREARTLNAGLGVLVVTAAAVGQGLGVVIEKLTESSRRQADLNLAVRSLDAGKVRSQLDELTTAQERFATLFGQNVGRILDATRTQGAFNILDKLFGRVDPVEIERARKALSDLVPIERDRAVAEARVKQLAATEQLVQVEQRRAAIAGNTATFVQTQERLVQLVREQTDAEIALLRVEERAAVAAARTRQEPPESIAQIQEAFGLRRRNLERAGESRGAVVTQAGLEADVALRVRELSLTRDIALEEEKAARSRRDRAGIETPVEGSAREGRERTVQLSDELISKELARLNVQQSQLSTIRSQNEGVERALALADENVENLNRLRDSILLTGQATIRVAAEGKDVALSVAVLREKDLVALDAAIVAETKKKNLLAGQLLDLQLQIDAHQRLVERVNLESQATQAALETRKIGMSEAERSALELQQIELRRATALAAIRDTDPNADLKRSAAELTAELERQQKAYEIMTRDDPFAGLRRGFQEAADDYGAAGRRMMDLTRNVAQTMSQTWSDTFFAVFTGDFKKLPDIAKQYTAGMLRAVTDELGKMITAPALRTLRDFFGTSDGSSGGSGSFFFGDRSSLVTKLAQSSIAGPAYQVVDSPSGLVGIGKDVSTGVTSTADALVPESAVSAANAQRTIVTSTSGGTSTSGIVSAIRQIIQTGVSGFRTFVGSPLYGGAASGALITGAPSMISSGGDGIIAGGGEGPAGSAIEPGSVAGAGSAAAGQDTSTGITSLGGLGGGTIGGYAGGVIGVAGAAYGAYSTGASGGGYAKSIIGGAITGAIAGSAFGPYGAAAGAVIGIVAGIIGAGEAEVRKDRITRNNRRRAMANDVFNFVSNAIDDGIDQRDVAETTGVPGYTGTVGDLLYSIALHAAAGDFEYDTQLDIAGSAPGYEQQKGAPANTAGLGANNPYVSRSIQILSELGRTPLEYNGGNKNPNNTIELVRNMTSETYGRTGATLTGPGAGNAGRLLERFVNKRDSGVKVQYGGVFAEAIPGAGTQQISETTIQSISNPNIPKNVPLSVLVNTAGGLTQDQLQRLYLRLQRMANDQHLGGLIWDDHAGVTVSVGLF